MCTLDGYVFLHCVRSSDYSCLQYFLLLFYHRGSGWRQSPVVVSSLQTQFVLSHRHAALIARPHAGNGPRGLLHDGCLTLLLYHSLAPTTDTTRQVRLPRLMMLAYHSLAPTTDTTRQVRLPRLIMLAYHSLAPTTAIIDYAIGLENLSANGQYFC